MAKYKNIESAIHNWAHSFLSIENYDEKGYFVKELYGAAKSENAEEVTLDVMSGKLSPNGVLTDRVESFLLRSRERFINQLQSQNVEQLRQFPRLQLELRQIRIQTTIRNALILLPALGVLL